MEVEEEVTGTKGEWRAELWGSGGTSGLKQIKTGCPVKLDFRINSEYLFSITISQTLLGSY